MSCKYCDGFGVLEQSDEASCPHCVTGKDVEEYFQHMDEGFLKAVEEKVKCVACKGVGQFFDRVEHPYTDYCCDCKGTGIKK